jgi:hypothetical protein
MRGEGLEPPGGSNIVEVAPYRTSDFGPLPLFPDRVARAGGFWASWEGCVEEKFESWYDSISTASGSPGGSARQSSIAVARVADPVKRRTPPL